jgi:hypothetical protein
MPYIPAERRDRLNLPIDELNLKIITAGELAYAITRLCLGHLPHDRGPTFFDLAGVIGVLETVKLEFYRRDVALYEDNKRHENGDVFP